MPQSSVISVRVTEQERGLLDEAATEARTNLSDYVRRQALDSAEIRLMERRQITVAAKDWAQFENWLNRPAQAKPALKELATSKPAWGK